MQRHVLVAIILLVRVQDADHVEDFALFVDARSTDGHALETGFWDQAHDCFNLALVHVRDSHERVSERLKDDLAKALVLLAVSEQDSNRAHNLIQN